MSSNQGNTSAPDDKKSGTTSASTYYGAIVIVVFILIALAIFARILYARRYNKRHPEIEEPSPDSREREERLAMERRGEEAGLPTYRQSILLPNNDTVLAATPMSNEPFLQRPNSADTLPNLATIIQIPEGDRQLDDTVQPPKYEADPVSPTAQPNTLSPNTHEMRMSTHSATTLVLPSTGINQASEDSPPQDSNRHDQQTSTTPPVSPSNASA